MFKMDGSKKNEADKEIEASKVRLPDSLPVALLVRSMPPQIDDVQRRLDQLDITNVSTDHIRDILSTRFADGDPARAADFIDLEQKAQAGIIVSHDPSIDLVGAENREGVTCYLDALLFAMFSKLDAFECMLNNDFPSDNPKYKLVNLLRIWVNMLRSGRLIQTDLVMHPPPLRARSSSSSPDETHSRRPR